MFNRDTFRLIKRTKKRFLTLFVIVIIGVAFMIGLFSSSPYLQYSVDAYDREYNLMDVQLYSSYGFCDEDIEAIKDTRGVKDAEGTHFVDVFATTGDEHVFVTRLQEADLDINQTKLIEGRLPKKPNEALVINALYETRFKIGDKVTVKLDDEEELKEKVANQIFEVVGIVESPQYMSATQEVSTLDNLDLETVLYIPNSNFIFDYYTSVYVTFESTTDMLAFSNQYQDEIDRNVRVLDRTKEQQDGYLKEKIIADVEKEIAEGEQELEDKVNEATAEIAKNQDRLDEAYIQLVTGESQITLNETQIEKGEKEIEKNEAIIKSNQEKIDAGIKAVEKQSGKPFNEAYEELETAYNLYRSLEMIKNDLPNQVGEASQKIVANKEKIANNNVILNGDGTAENPGKRAELLALETEKEVLEAELALLVPDSEEYLAKEAEIAAKQVEIDTLVKEIDAITIENEALVGENIALQAIIDNQDGASEQIQGMLDKIDEEAGGSVETAYLGVKQLKDGIEQLEAGKAQLAAAKKEIETGKAQLLEAKTELAKGRKEYESGVKQLDDAVYQLETEKEKAQNELAKARQDLEELPDAEWMILDRNSHYSSVMFDATLGQMNSIGHIFPLLFFAVAALVCLTTMTRLIDEERTQLGVFSALGFSKNKIISKYVLYAFLASFGGSLVGIVVGVFTFPLVIYQAWRLMYLLPEVKMILLPSVAFAGVASFTLLMMGVTYYVAHRELKTMPSQLMRPKPPKTAKQVLVEKIPFIWNHLSFTSKITVRNIFRYKSRFVMTVIGVAGCTGLLVAGYGIKDSISDVIKLNFSEIYKYNYTIALEDDRYEKPVYEALLEDSNNEQVVPFMKYISKVYFEDEDEKTISVEVFDERQIDRVVNLRTRKNHDPLDISGDGVIISEKFAKIHNLKVGDEVTIESKNGIKAIVEIDGICEMYFQHHIFMSDELYEDLFNENVHNEYIGIIAKDGDALNKDILNQEGVVSITSFEPMIESFENMIQALDFIIMVIILAAGSLAFVVLMNLTAVNISERLREIATLKVLGFNDKEVNHYIFEEIIILTVIGGLVGAPIGKLEHTIIMSVIDVEMVMFGSNIRLASFVYGFLITMCFTAIVLFFMKKNLKEVEMVESLKSVE